MAGTTPVTIHKEVAFSFTQTFRQEIGHAWAPSTDEITPHQQASLDTSEQKLLIPLMSKFTLLGNLGAGP